jgi:uncharacterized protein (DUF1501 family)
MRRRDFFKRTLAAGAGLITVGGFSMRAYGRAADIGVLSAAADAPPNDRVLVVVQLQGGNDGLNTVVPHADDAYYKARPTLGLKQAGLTPISDTLGLHASLAPLKPVYDSGRLAIVQGVGYANPDRSHFRSTDIWLTGSNADEVLTTGWLGRYVDYQFPNFHDDTTRDPLAIHISSVLSLSLQGKSGGAGIALQDPVQFFNLVNRGNQIIGTGAPPTPAGHELQFVRGINAESLQYSKQVKAAADRGKNAAQYPSGSLAGQLALVARLVAGGLKTRIYIVSQGGYDTHATQGDRHAQLLGELGKDIAAFQDDLQKLGVSNRVVGMTISEFGRRVAENGSQGTDHGTSAPLFLFGDRVRGGVLGPNPNFTRLDPVGDLVHTYDFRQVYASVLRQWFEVSDAGLSAVFPRSLALLPLVQAAQGAALMGDFNSDGKVDFDDFFAFAQAFGSADSVYDLDKSGKVDFNDFFIFSDNFGRRR